MTRADKAWLGRLGRHVRRAREAAGLSLREVARRSGTSRHPVSASGLRRIESGRNVKVTKIAGVAAGIGCTARELWVR